MTRKQTINNDPTPSFYRRCQFMAMNFQNLDVDMKHVPERVQADELRAEAKAMWPKPDVETASTTDHMQTRGRNAPCG